MFVTNGKNKVAICPYCAQPIKREQGYRYFLGKLLCDGCYSPFIQQWRQGHRKAS